MKLIRCDDCSVPIALTYQWLECECGLSAGGYLPDGDRVVIAGPCQLIGIENGVFLGRRVEAYPYDETKKTRDGKPKVIRLAHNPRRFPERTLA